MAYNQGTGFSAGGGAGLEELLTADTDNYYLGVNQPRPTHSLDVAGTLYADKVVALSYSNLQYAALAGAPTKLSQFANDLPAPPAQVQTDWAQTNPASMAFVANKPGVASTASLMTFGFPAAPAVANLNAAGNMVLNGGLLCYGANSYLPGLTTGALSNTGSVGVARDLAVGCNLAVGSNLTVNGAGSFCNLNVSNAASFCNLTVTSNARVAGSLLATGPQHLVGAATFFPSLPGFEKGLLAHEGLLTTIPGVDLVTGVNTSNAVLTSDLLLAGRLQYMSKMNAVSVGVPKVAFGYDHVIVDDDGRVPWSVIKSAPDFATKNFVRAGDAMAMLGGAALGAIVATGVGYYLWHRKVNLTVQERAWVRVNAEGDIVGGRLASQISEYAQRYGDGISGVAKSPSAALNRMNPLFNPFGGG